MRKSGKKPVGPVDLRTHRLNVSSSKPKSSFDPGKFYITADAVRGIVEEIESGKYSSPGSTTELPEHSGPVSEQAEPAMDDVTKLGVLKERYKVALVREASGAGLRQDTKKALKDYLELYLRALNNTKQSLTKQRTALKDRLDSTKRVLAKQSQEFSQTNNPSVFGEDYSERRMSVGVMEKEYAELNKLIAQLDKDIGEVENHYPGRIEGRGDRSQRDANYNFESALSKAYEALRDRYYGKSIAGSGTDRISQHIAMSPPEDKEAITYETARVLAQFIIKTNNMVKKGISDAYTVDSEALYENEEDGDARYYTATYVDEKYEKAVNDLMLKIEGSVSPDSPLINAVASIPTIEAGVESSKRVEVYRLIDRPAVEKLVRDFNISLTPTRVPTNKKYSKLYNEGVSTKIKSILNTSYTIAYKACLPFIQAKSLPTNSDDILMWNSSIKDACEYVLDFIELYTFFNSLPSDKTQLVTKDAIDKNTAVVNHLSQSFMDTGFVDGSVLIHKLVDEIYSSMPKVSNLGYVFSEINIKKSKDGKNNSLMDFIHKHSSNMFINTGTFNMAEKSKEIDLEKSKLEVDLQRVNLLRTQIKTIKRIVTSLIPDKRNLVMLREFIVKLNDTLKVMSESGSDDYYTIFRIGASPEFTSLVEFSPDSQIVKLVTAMINFSGKVIDPSTPYSNLEIYKNNIENIQKDISRRRTDINSEISKINKKINQDLQRLSKLVEMVSYAVNDTNEAQVYGKFIELNGVRLLLDEVSGINSLDNIPMEEPDSMGTSVEIADKENIQRENAGKSPLPIPVPDIFYVFVKGAMVGALKSKAPLVMGRKRRKTPAIRSVMANKEVSRLDHIAAYSNQSISQRDMDALSDVQGTDVTRGRSPWFYIYTPIVSAVSGRGMSATPLIGPFRAKDAFRIQNQINTSKYRYVAPRDSTKVKKLKDISKYYVSGERKPFKVTLTQADNVEKFIDLAKLISLGDPDSKIYDEIQSSFSSSKSYMDNYTKMVTVDLPKQEDQLYLLLYGIVKFYENGKYHRSSPKSFDELVSTYLNYLYSSMLTVEQKDIVDKGTNLEPLTTKSILREFDFYINRGKVGYLFKYPALIPEAITADFVPPANLTEVSRPADVDSIKKLSTLVEARSAIDPNKRLDVLIYQIIYLFEDDIESLYKSGLAELIPVESIMSDDPAIQQIGLDVFEQNAYQFLTDKIVDFPKLDIGKAEDKHLSTLKTEAVRMAKNIAKYKGMIASAEENLPSLELQVARRSGEFIGTRCVVIDIRKFIAAVGVDDVAAMGDAIYANDRATVAQIGLNPMGTIAGLLHYFNNFMVINYGKGKLIVTEDSEDDDDDEWDDEDYSLEDRVTIGLNFYEAAQLYYDIKEEGNKAGIFEIRMNRPSMDKTYKFNPERYWRHILHATKSFIKERDGEEYVEDDEEDDGIADVPDPTDDEFEDDDRTAILDNAEYRASIRGVYPIATNDIDVSETADTSIRFLQSVFLPIFLNKVKEKYEDSLSERENPYSGGKAVGSEIYILWFLEAYDASKGINISERDRVSCAHKVTLEEMVKEGYCNPDGSLTGLGKQSCNDVVVTPWLKARFNSISMNNMISNKVRAHISSEVRDNPRGYALSASPVLAKDEGNKNVFLRSTKPDDFLDKNTEVVMYRPKIKTADGKYYRPRIHLVKPKNITLDESISARKAIRGKAKSSVVLDPNSRKYVHTPAGPMSKREAISFYLDPSMPGPVKEVAPLKRLKKLAGPRGRDMASEVIKFSGDYEIGGEPKPTLTTNSSEGIVLQSVHFYYANKVANMDNKGKITDNMIDSIARNTYVFLMDEYYNYYDQSESNAYIALKKSFGAIITGATQATTRLNFIEKYMEEKNTTKLTAELNKLNALDWAKEVLAVGPSYNNTLSKFMSGRFSAKGAMNLSVVKNILIILRRIWQLASSASKDLTEGTVG